ncbi:uncharacterized protein LOC118455363 [Neolamprologus brichardi]|uniref:uncharacterized protein LOC118455363 n=1 Tax=Neolamprologus brichardi TaxID=32507 RepID=UPI001643E4BA|nr:uncharacterized protein LOC118455363 [Neolamprologus brichardi]
MWLFPAQKFKYVLEEVHTCEGSLNNLQEELTFSSQRLPLIQDQFSNFSARLEPYNYLHSQGLYTELSLRQLGQELSQLQVDIDVVHSQLNNSETQKLSKEADRLHKHVNKMQTIDTLNMKTVKEKLRYLKNNVETCKSIPKDFRAVAAKTTGEAWIAAVTDSSSSDRILARNEAGDERSDRDCEDERLIRGREVDKGDSGLEKSLSEPTQNSSGPRGCGGER